MLTPALVEQGIYPSHVRGNGSIETAAEFEDRLLAETKVGIGILDGLFAASVTEQDRQRLLAEAYRVQARRKGFVLHHTTIAHSMDVKLVTQLIRIGRDRVSERGVRSAEKEVSPLSWFTELSCAEVTAHMERSFEAAFAARRSALSQSEVEHAHGLVDTKYATPAWIERLP